jgi:hypothetical protein
VVETKDFIPLGHAYWFKNPIPTPDAFEEGNMANISLTIKVEISIKPCITEDIILDVVCSSEEVLAYKAYFSRVSRYLFLVKY